MSLPETAFYILHRRPYQESSVILDCLTYQTGRLSLIAKGAKRRSKQWGTCLQPFVLLQGSWQGRSDLKTLTDIAIIKQHSVRGRNMLIGFYINELMIRLLHKQAPCPEVFQLYHQLFQSPMDEPHLRYFEKDLLDVLGYGFSCRYEANTGNPIEADQQYCFRSECGFVYPLASGVDDRLVDGATIIALYHRCLETNDQQRQAKYILRRALHPLLGQRPLKSRSLFL